VPLLLNLDVRLINATGIVGAVQVRPIPLIQLWRIALYPAKDGRMIDKDASFPQQFFHITIAQGIPQISPHRAEDEGGFIVAPFE
jgi:hypothetical protein